MTNHEDALQILLVEDNPADAELTMHALRKGHLVNQVRWVKDGAEALEVLFGQGAKSVAECGRLKLIMLDLRLPRVDGLDVLRAIRADQRTSHLPVVVLTSSREEVDIVRAYDLGASSYLVKPVDSEAFSRAVGELGLYWMLLNKVPGETK